jgi:hypothetical protein
MEGEFSFADMIADAERLKTADGKVSNKQTEREVSHLKYESPPPKKAAVAQLNRDRGNLYGHAGLGDEEKTHAMISTDYTLSFLPSLCWAGPRNIGIESPQAMEGSNVLTLNAIATSFLPCGISIAISSTTDFISIRSFGIVSFRILFSKDMSRSNDEGKEAGAGAGAGGAAGRGGKGKEPQVQVRDVQVPPPDHASSATMSPSDSYTNTSPSHSIKFFVHASTTSVKTPWPCNKVEAMIMQRNSDFPCVLSVQTYSTSSIRSSAASTPQAKPKQHSASGKMLG